MLLAALFGRNLSHLHRPESQDNEYDLNGEFWKRHRFYDNILLNIALQLPNHLRLPGGVNDSNVIFTNMCIHTSTICLHQAAIFKAERNKMPAQMITESKRRCIVAADQVSNIMKLISHTDLTIVSLEGFQESHSRRELIDLIVEPVPFVLCLCFCTRVCAISEITTE